MQTRGRGRGIQPPQNILLLCVKRFFCGDGCTQPLDPSLICDWEYEQSFVTSPHLLYAATLFGAGDV